jgi:hypothetical protein
MPRVGRLLVQSNAAWLVTTYDEALSRRKICPDCLLQVDTTVLYFVPSQAPSQQLVQDEHDWRRSVAFLLVNWNFLMPRNHLRHPSVEPKQTTAHFLTFSREHGGLWRI